MDNNTQESIITQFDSLSSNNTQESEYTTQELEYIVIFNQDYTKCILIEESEYAAQEYILIEESDFIQVQENTQESEYTPQESDFTQGYTQESEYAQDFSGCDEIYSSSDSDSNM